MASDTQSCLLLDRIPREIRNIIYEYLTVDDLVHITKTPEPDAELTNMAHLANAPITNVFQVCKQMRDEYKDTCYKDSAIIIYASKLSLRQRSFDFKLGVPKELFKNVTACHVKIPFYLLQQANDPELLREFIIDVSDGESEGETDERQWTPSIDSVGYLSIMLNELAQWIQEKQASVTIDIMVYGGAQHFEEWAHRRMVQAPTFAEFTCDPDTAFTAVRKVDLCFSLDVPLSSEVKAWDIDPDIPIAEEDVAEEDVAAEAIPDDKTVRETEDGILYETADSKQKCTWMLLPMCRAHAAAGFCGFRPLFRGISQCTCCNHH